MASEYRPRRTKARPSANWTAATSAALLSPSRRVDSASSSRFLRSIEIGKVDVRRGKSRIDVERLAEILLGVLGVAGQHCDVRHVGQAFAPIRVERTGLDVLCGRALQCGTIRRAPVACTNTQQGCNRFDPNRSRFVTEQWTHDFDPLLGWHVSSSHRN